MVQTFITLKSFLRNKTVWYQLNIDNCPCAEVEQLSDELQDMGALSVTLTDKFDEPILEPEVGTTPLWPQVIITALFDDQASATSVKKQLLHAQSYLDITIETFADKDWQQACMSSLKAQCFGHKLWICPSWQSPPEPMACNLILDPGLAFGTGTHATTQLCLTWLAQTDLKDKALIDYGCGSGILALAALKLGASQVKAVDIDPQAIQATHDNAQRNHIEPGVNSCLSVCEPQQLDTNKVDIIIANILLKPLLALNTDFRQRLNPCGKLVVSGILVEQVQELVDSYSANFVYQEHHNLDGWSQVIFNVRALQAKQALN